MPRARENLSVVVLASAVVLLAGCGGGSSSHGGVAYLGSNAGSRAAAGDSGAGPGQDSGAGSQEGAALAFAKCMRSNGLPNFPDPQSGGGFLFRRGAGAGPSSPAFKAAQAKCKQFLPPGPGSGPPPSAQALGHMLKVAQCMRRHGVPEFPDPRTSVPSNLRPPPGASRFVVSDIEGVILVMGSIDTQSPAFTRAAAVCAFPLHNH